jgi:hypothetical protein
MRRFHLLVSTALISIALFTTTVRSANPATQPAKPAPAGPTYSLADFGPLDKPAQVQETYLKAIEELKKTGGVLMVPSSVWRAIKAVPLQGLERTPPPPAQTKVWKTGKGVTVVVAEEQGPLVELPPLTGLTLARDFRLAEGDSAPHWGTHPMVTLNNEIAYGSISYLDWLQEPVSKGPDRRFYVATVRGLAPGMFLNIHGGPGYGGGVCRACIKSVGYDADKKMSFIVADTTLDHVTGAILHNKSNVGLLHMTQTSNCDNQTYDVKVIRNQYAHGDTYIYYCDFNYMSNVHSAAGDENGNCYAAFIRSLEGGFHGIVESVDWDKSELRFKDPSSGINTLGDSRPLINLNPRKAITAGTVLIVPAECYYDPVDTGSCKFQGRNYPTQIINNARTGVRELKMGGLIRGNKDCPWTRDIIGRYFAVNTPDEKTPKGTFRWYEITSLTENPDGTKDIEIRRFWWGAKSAGSPTLYSPGSYTWDDHLRPLSYIIAPGTYVNDVSRALPGGDRGGQRILGVAAYCDQGKDEDFAPGDPVEQAIGPDPFKPEAFRCWAWEDVPGAFPSAFFDFANLGATSRFAAFNIHGAAASLEDVARRREKKPAWDNIMVVDSAATVGLNWKADFTNAAILFNQPNHEQPIKWLYDAQPGQRPKEAVLTVSRDTGEFNFQGGGIRAGGPVAQVQGLSGDKTQARNLRGKNIPIQEKAASLRVKFAQSEADGDYAVFVEQSWLTNRAISDKGPDGFTITFASPAPAGSKVDWMIVR